MGSIGDVFPYPAPVIGSADWANWMLVTDELITRVSSPVPLSAIEGGDLDMDGNAIINVKDIEFEEQGSVPAATPGKFYFYNDEWWLVNTSGAIQITDGGTLNVTVNGGIGGDYGGTNPASVRFVDADKRYDFYDDYGGLAWAYTRARGFDIAAGATSTFRARLIYGGAGNLTFTLPPTLPASDSSVLQVSSTGAIVYNSAATPLTNAIHISASEPIFCGNQTVVFNSNVDAGGTGVGNVFTNSTFGVTNASTAAGGFTTKLPGLKVGWRIKTISLYCTKVTTDTVTMTLKRSYFGAFGGITDILATASDSTIGDEIIITATLGTPEFVTGGISYSVLFESTSDDGPTQNECFGPITVTYDIIP
jgi:hypothetical protein